MLQGLNGYTGVSGGSFDPQFQMRVSGKITVSGSSKEFELNHWTADARANGLGLDNTGLTSDEVYADVKIWKVG